MGLPYEMQFVKSHAKITSLAGRCDCVLRTQRVGMLSLIVTGTVTSVIHDELRHARWRRERGKAANMQLIDQSAP